MSSAPQTSGDAALPKVVAVVLVRDPSTLSEGLEALGRQVYEASSIVALGGGDEAKSVAEAAGAEWMDSFKDITASLPVDVTYLWVVDQLARPRPDALVALVRESERLDASIAGSKVLAAEDPDLLLSVGMATDVFAVPYLGLEPGERDQAQYDVIRTVAAVPPASMLVRRDLVQGLQGPDRDLAPEAAGIDFSQRARLRGARVLVVPSSEVLMPQEVVADERRSWREEAGRLRAMLKSYSLVTLVWALPLAFLTGLLEALLAPLIGRWTFGDFIRAWAWNVVKLPSTIKARAEARRGRVAGDEELFRYQVSGSARLRALFAALGQAIADRLPATQVGGLSGIIESGATAMRRPGFISASVAIVLVLLAARDIWAGRLPAVGFTLPPSEDAGMALSAYAGGWNPAGLGTPWPLRPFVALVALVQWVVGGNGPLAASLVTVGAAVSGVVAIGRLARGWGITAPPAYAGAVAYALGPVALAIGRTTHWPAVVGLGLLPWVLVLAIRPWPRSWSKRVARLSGITLFTGLSAAAVPPLLVVPATALALWALVGHGERWWAAGRAAVGAALAAPLLLPWASIVSIEDVVELGAPAFWRPWWPLVAVVAVAAVATVVAGSRVLAGLAGWGGALAAGGLLIARSGDAGFGSDIQLTGMILAALGTAFVVAASFELWAQLQVAGTVARSLAAAAGVAALMIVAIAAVSVVGGRLGLPADEWRDRLDFTAASQGQGTRVLLMGEAASLPGESREFAGTAYRVVSAPLPLLWEAHLGPERIGDDALDEALSLLAAGEVARAGELLSPFGIRWVMGLDDVPFIQAFERQLDLVPLPGLDEAVFASEADATRALASDGSVWRYEPPVYRGDPIPGGSVVVAETADARWSPEPWQQSSWANEVSAATGVAAFQARDDLRSQAWLALIWLVALLVVFVIGSTRWVP